MGRGAGLLGGCPGEAPGVREVGGRLGNRRKHFEISVSGLGSFARSRTPRLWMHLGKPYAGLWAWPSRQHSGGAFTQHRQDHFAPVPESRPLPGSHWVLLRVSECPWSTWSRSDRVQMSWPLSSSQPQLFAFSWVSRCSSLCRAASPAGSAAAWPHFLWV